MGLLERMRAGTDSTFMQVVLGLVVVSFVFWYAAPQGDQASVVATVNGVQLTDTELVREYRLALRQQRRALHEEEEAQLRESIRQQLIQDEVIYQEAKRLGLEVSDTEVARQLLEIPAFRDEDGRFDERIYTNHLRSMGFTRSDFEENLRRDLLRDKLRRLVFFGATVSEPMVREYYVRTNTRVDLQYVRVRPELFEDDVEVTEEGLDTFLEENRERVEAEYSQDFERLYDVPEKVQLHVIELTLLRDGLGAAELLPRMNAIRRELESGADFTALARRWSEDPSAAAGGDMGLQAVPQLDQEVAEAIAELEPGQLSKVVTNDDGLHLYRLDAREEAHVIPLEEVQRDIAERLHREQQAPALAAEFADRVLAEWSAAGAPPLELLEPQGMAALTTGPITTRPEGMLSPPTTLLDAAMEVPVGSVLPEVYEQAGVLWVAALLDRVEPDMDLYQDESEMIREETLMARRGELYESWVTDLVARADIE